MILAVIVGLCGAILAQHYRAMILIPATLMTVAFAASAGALGMHGGSQTLLEALSVVGALQIGYFFGLVIKPVVAGRRKAQLNTA